MKTIRELCLGGAALAIGILASEGAFAADLPTLAQPGAYGGWTFDGSAQFGAQAFITKPGSTPNSTQATTNAFGTQFLPSSSNSAAKFNEYGNQLNPLFLSFLNFNIASPGADFRANLLGSNIGANNQKLEADLEQPGRQYLTLGWYETPNLYSNTAQTIFNGVGSTNLTVPNDVVQSLYGGLFPSGTLASGPGKSYANITGNPSAVATPAQAATNVLYGVPTNAAASPVKYTLAGQPLGCFLSSQAGTAACNGKTPVQTTINNNEHLTNLGIQRDRGEVDYRWTPDEHWDVNVQYSNEHRYGVQEQGFLFSTGTTTPMAAVPMPVDDVTQNASMSAEYYGLSPWGMKWNGILKYDVSLYTDAFSAFQATNPFGGPGSPAPGVPLCPTASATAIPNCYGTGQMGTAPDSAANTVMGQVGVDLPWFKSSRYMGTVQYSVMTQNEAFIPMTINALGVTGNYPTPSTANSALTTALNPVPRSSLQGQVDTLLFNNVLTSQINSQLKNKVTYRYYSYDNNTPPLTLQNWIVNDAAIATTSASAATGANVGTGSYAPHTTLFGSYTKQDLADELTYSPTTWSGIGESTGWERYQYSQYAANVTDEITEKVFAHATPTDWFTVRVEDAQSWRRYQDYNWQLFVGDVMLAGAPGTAMVENPYLRDFDIANRNRNVANIYGDITTPISGLTLTPTAGWRWDDYPTDPSILGGTQLGLTSDHEWNVGIEADWVVTSNISFVASYNYQNIAQTMIGSSSASNSPAQHYNGTMGENVNTVMAGFTFQFIPDQLSLKLSGTHEWATDSLGTGPAAGCLAANAGSGANCGLVSAGNPAYPPENTHFDHLDATLMYKMDPTLLNLGSKDEAILQLHYLYERNNVTNWQSSGAAPYMYSTLNASTTAFRDMIFLAGDNPNYTAQAIMASLVVKW